MHNRGLTLLEILVIVVVIGILAALFLPPTCGGRHKNTACQNNLHQLYILGTAYANSHRGEWPKAKGSDLWIGFTKTTPPLIDPDALGILFCPVRGDETPGECDYRGPGKPFSQLGPGDLLGADAEENHGEEYGGNVLLKDGSVIEAAPGDALWKKCREQLRPQ